jgi:hypothetical protein
VTAALIFKHFAWTIEIIDYAGARPFARIEPAYISMRCAV